MSFPYLFSFINSADSTFTAVPVPNYFRYVSTIFVNLETEIFALSFIQKVFSLETVSVSINLQVLKYELDSKHFQST